MFSSNGKFIIYTPKLTGTKRLQIIGSAVTKIAETLKLKIIVTKKNKLLSTYVYYIGHHNNEEIPVYCDWGKNWSENEIYNTIKSVMFTLSFHPKYKILENIRRYVV